MHTIHKLNAGYLFAFLQRRNCFYLDSGSMDVNDGTTLARSFVRSFVTVK
jgi:hypothetical protein